MYNINSTIQLRNGNHIPLFGLGTFQSESGNVCKNAVLTALQQGYRLIDTAILYGNESDVGDAIIESNIPREEIFVVTKLHIEKHGKKNAISQLKESLKRLKLDYVDLYLIHSPTGGSIIETWKGMIDCKELGLTRVIGVSNFGVNQLEGMKQCSVEMPEVNQIELHVWMQQKDCVEWCRKENIGVMGYCPLAKTRLFGKTPIYDIAKEISKTEAQIAIRWSIESGIITIPKSVNPIRIKENADVFDFDLGNKYQSIFSHCDCKYKSSVSVNHMYISWNEIK